MEFQKDIPKGEGETEINVVVDKNLFYFNEILEKDFDLEITKLVNERKAQIEELD